RGSRLLGPIWRRCNWNLPDKKQRLILDPLHPKNGSINSSSGVMRSASNMELSGRRERMLS
ncbi:MAG: hypothetical protein ACK43N_13170, partial [Pirellulaceae bacterium]